MLLFGHIGITLGAAYAASVIANRIEAPSSPTTNSDVTRRGPVFRGRVLDWRLLAIGSMLPDIIDKPIGVLFFASDGRLWAHTLLFAAVLMILGLFLALTGKPWLLIIAVCNLGHIALDGMWTMPEVLFWPAYGWNIAPPYAFLDWEALRHWLSLMNRDLKRELPTLVSEAVGGLVVIILFWQWVIRGHKPAQR